MKRLIALLLACALPLTVALAGEPLAEEAILAMVREEILLRCESDDPWFPYTLEDFEPCTRAVAFHTVYPDGTSGWNVEFSQPTVQRWPELYAFAEWTPVFTAYVDDAQPTAFSVSYHDPYCVREITWQAAFAHHSVPSRYWPLEDKQRFYEQLMAVYEREMAYYGGLPNSGYAEMLGHVQSVPREGELAEAEAIDQARAALIAQGIPADTLEAAQTAVFLWRDEGQPALYHIAFYDDADALVGEITLEAAPVKF